MRAMVVAAMLAAAGLGACTDHQVRSTARGGLIGGTVGLVAGALYGDPVDGAAQGAVLGAAAGAIVGTLDEIGDDDHHHRDGGYRDRDRRHGYRGGYRY
jgi:uncharacterized membrane protein